MFSTSDYVNVKELLHIREGQNLMDASAPISKHRLTEIPIVDSKDHVTAVLDVFKLINHLMQLTDPDHAIPSDCLRRRINTIGLDEPLENAAHFPVDRIVLDSNEKYQGILRRVDVIRGLAKEIEMFHSILNQLDIGVGVISTDKQLIYANQSFNEVIDPNTKNLLKISLDKIINVLPDREQWMENIPLRYHYDKDDPSVVLQYYPLNYGKENVGVLVLILGKHISHEFHSIVSASGTRRKGGLKEIQKTFPNIVIVDPNMEKVVRLALKAAKTVSNVFITGETGVGKEIVAEIVHRMGPRSNRTFLKVNCAAIPESLLESELFGYEKGAFTGAAREGKQGLIEAANGGTLFLDEINSLPMQLQAKLLRFLQNKEFIKIGGTRVQHGDVRLLVASNCDVKELVQKGRFRQDLYYRLCVIPIQIPPLKERKKDIAPLAQHFLKHFCSLYHSSKELDHNIIPFFEQYEWPGNVRELEHLIEQLVVLVDEKVIDTKHLPQDMRPRNKKTEAEIQVKVDNLIPLKEAQDLMEQEIFREALRQGGSVRQIANKLRIHHSTVVRKLQRYRVASG